MPIHASEEGAAVVLGRARRRRRPARTRRRDHGRPGGGGEIALLGDDPAPQPAARRCVVHAVGIDRSRALVTLQLKFCAGSLHQMVLVGAGSAQVRLPTSAAWCRSSRRSRAASRHRCRRSGSRSSARSADTSRRPADWRCRPGTDCTHRRRRTWSARGEAASEFASSSTRTTRMPSPLVARAGAGGIADEGDRRLPLGAAIDDQLVGRGVVRGEVGVQHHHADRAADISHRRRLPYPSANRGRWSCRRCRGSRKSAPGRPSCAFTLFPARRMLVSSRVSLSP